MDICAFYSALAALAAFISVTTGRNQNAVVSTKAVSKPDKPSSPWDVLDYFTYNNDGQNKVLRLAINETRNLMQQYLNEDITVPEGPKDEVPIEAAESDKESVLGDVTTAALNVRKRADWTSTMNSHGVKEVTSVALATTPMNDVIKSDDVATTKNRILTTTSPATNDDSSESEKNNIDPNVTQTKNSNRSKKKKNQRRKHSKKKDLSTNMISNVAYPSPGKEEERKRVKGSVITNLIVDDYYSDLLDTRVVGKDPRASRVVQSGSRLDLDSGALWMVVIVLGGLFMAAMLITVSYVCVRYHSNKALVETKKCTNQDHPQKCKDTSNKDYQSDVFYNENHDSIWQPDDVTIDIDVMSSIPNYTMTEKVEVENECENVSLASSSSSMLSLNEFLTTIPHKTGNHESNFPLTPEEVAELRIPDFTLPLPQPSIYDLRTIENV